MKYKLTFSLLTFFALLILSSNVSAFRSTNQESFTDPDYIGYQPKKIILNVQNVDLDSRAAVEKTLIDEFSKRGVEASSYLNYFPPTRNYSDEQIAEVLKKNNIDSVIVFSFGPYNQTLTPLGTSTTGSSNTAGSINSSGAFNANTNYSSYSYNVVVPKSTSSFNAYLYDALKNRVAWQITISVKASGMLFVGQEKDAKAAAKSIIKELIAKKHLPEK